MQEEKLLGAKASSTGGNNEIDDLMSGSGDHQVSINRESSANKKLNAKAGLTNPYL